MNKTSTSWKEVNIKRKNTLIVGFIFLIPFYIFLPSIIGQFLCLFLLFILIGSRLYTEYLIRNIIVYRQDSELRAFKYEQVKMEIKIINCGILPAFMMVARDSPGPLPIFKNNKIIKTLTRRSWIFFSWEGYCPERGEFHLGPVYIDGADPLGIFSFRLIANETTRLFVYPVYRSIFVKPPGGIPLGSMSSSNPLFEDITHRRSLRPYHNGDELRRINWKVSARMSQTSQTGGLMVNEYEARASYPLMVFLNADRNEYPAKKQTGFIERSIEAAAAICLRASVERQELGIIIYSSAFEDRISVITPSTYTLVPILERLAILDWKKDVNNIRLFLREGNICGSARTMLDQGKYLSYGTRFFYIGPDLGDEAYISLDSLKRYHLSLEYLIIDDRAMPSLVPGKSMRYQMKEKGREII